MLRHSFLSWVLFRVLISICGRHFLNKSIQSAPHIIASVGPELVLPLFHFWTSRAHMIAQIHPTQIPTRIPYNQARKNVVQLHPPLLQHEATKVPKAGAIQFKIRMMVAWPSSTSTIAPAQVPSYLSLLIF